MERGTSRKTDLTLGLRFSGGRRRLIVDRAATGEALRVAICRALNRNDADASSVQIHRDVNGRPGDQIRLTRLSTVATLKLKDGDVLNVNIPDDRASAMNDVNDYSVTDSVSSVSTATVDTANGVVKAKVVEIDAVDDEMWQLDGRIERTEKQCRHDSSKARCFRCSPIEPYDEAHLKAKGVKYLSFHAFLRQTVDALSVEQRRAFAAASRKRVAPPTPLPSLDPISCRLTPCPPSVHKPWPASLCSACQPPPVTLTGQRYRHCDRIEFENHSIVDRFLAYWRETGAQRVGFLYGRYVSAHSADLPLGIKAVVAAIYEPAQECHRDYVRLVDPGQYLSSADRRDVDATNDTSDKTAADAVGGALGLQCVGWIFTDLVASNKKGGVRHIRDASTHFLSAQECISAAHLQLAHPNRCREAAGGAFGSKFVTVVVSGDATSQIHMEGYQVSNQCASLVRDDCLTPTVDAPELGYIRQSTAARYVPDVFYKRRDEYGNEVTQLARPLPVDYLIVDVPVSAPREPAATFNAATSASTSESSGGVGAMPPSPSPPLFAIENRPFEGQIQDFASLARHHTAWTEWATATPDRACYSSQQLTFFADFHLLLYLATQKMSPLSWSMTRRLLDAVRRRDAEEVAAWSADDAWQTINLLLEAQRGGFQ